MLINDDLKKMAIPHQQGVNYSAMYDYDFGEIARKRTDNYLILDRMIRDKKYEDFFVPLKQDAAIKNAVPQSYPVLIKSGNRDKIYEIMNSAGFGVVSLYHTLIPELQTDEFEESRKVSKYILNLPVHQDVEPKYYGMLLERLTVACVETSVN